MQFRNKICSEEIKRLFLPFAGWVCYNAAMNTRIRKKLIREGLLPAQFEVPADLSTGEDNSRFTGESCGNGEKSFWCWFWEDVIGLSSESYRREFWRAAQRGYTIGPVPETLVSWQRRRGVPIRARVGDAVLVLLVVGGPALVFHLVRRLVRRHISHLRRPTYYDRERERRIALGRQRRAITARRTYNPKPTFEAIRAAWNGARHSPEGALRLGGLLEDLECYVNNHARGDAATGYRGRYGGIKRLLEAEAPDLFAHYAALMRYKSIARRFRQACGLEDPVPVDAVLPLQDVARLTQTGSMGGQTQEFESAPHDGAVEGNICSEEIKRSGMPDTVAESAHVVVREAGIDITRERSGGMVVEGVSFPKRAYVLADSAYATAVRVLRRCERSVISLEAALALEIAPELAGLKSDGAMESSKTPGMIAERVLVWIRRKTRAA